jgi:hypothetical protein
MPALSLQNPGSTASHAAVVHSIVVGSYSNTHSSPFGHVQLAPPEPGHVPIAVAFDAQMVSIHVQPGVAVASQVASSTFAAHGSLLPAENTGASSCAHAASANAISTMRIIAAL